MPRFVLLLSPSCGAVVVGGGASRPVSAFVGWPPLRNILNVVGVVEETCRVQESGAAASVQSRRH